MDWSYPHVGTACIVLQDGKLLMGQRLSSTGGGSWCIPGGKLDKYELMADCAVRETLEETGVAVRNPRFVTYIEDRIPEWDIHFITFYFKAEVFRGSARDSEPEKFHNVGWVAKEDMPSPLFIPFQNLLSSGIDPYQLP